MREVFEILTPTLRKVLEGVDDLPLEEIRIRKNRPLSLIFGEEEVFINARGEYTFDQDNGVGLAEEEFLALFQLITASSYYALEEELKQGYITIKGGHRIGFTGQAVLENGKIRHIKNVSSINIRIAREIKGVAENFAPYLVNNNGEPVNTLILSPPRSGKTTMLRDLARIFANGSALLGIPGIPVGIVDERSEIAASYKGEPQLDVGIRADVLDGCPKAQGMIILLRSMAPKLIVTDEIGREEDVGALVEVANAGVAIFTSAHARDMDDLKRRLRFLPFLKLGIFERYVILSRREGPGTVEAVLDAQGKVIIGRD
ncbi:stage III sporulation protein AA [Carboxydothermus islandicus]|uniref:Stage III sporulation protein AA n=1 Tax=Carboxydothermus islandicus TaxID=661089 RepID=A0A1L8D3B6_9THEO|nr:stage III sporulation protein AA [Carboxydothermus islandicus]GAV25672.1 stage III sporulation protein AA [Carboxydothermus islandicus]